MNIPDRIIDSHQHVFWHGRDDAGLIADLDSHQIESAWLLTWEIAPWEDSPAYHRVLNPLHRRADGTHAGIPLSDLLKARDNFPDRFSIGYCPHPMIGNPVDLLDAAVRMYDVKVCGEWKFRIPFDDPRCIELFRAAGERNLPVVLHLDVPYLANAQGGFDYQPLWYGGTVANLERALQACPDTTFIGHAPGFWREISGDAAAATESYPKGNVAPGGQVYRLLDEYSNLYADLSAGSALFALNRDPDHARTFLTRFSDRLLFARDYYGDQLHKFLQTMDLPQEAAKKIYHSNAEQLLVV